MPEAATPHDPPVIDPDVLDELIPPPGPRWRRVARWTALLLVVAMTIWGALTGTIVPHADPELRSWGGGPGPVAISVNIANHGRSPIVVTDALRPPAGLRLLGYSTDPESADLTRFDATQVEQDPFPLHIGRRGSVLLTAWYEVQACDAIAESGPATVTTAIELPVLSLRAVTRTIEPPFTDAGSSESLWMSTVDGVCGSRAAN